MYSQRVTYYTIIAAISEVPSIAKITAIIIILEIRLLVFSLYKFIKSPLKYRKYIHDIAINILCERMNHGPFLSYIFFHIIISFIIERLCDYAHYTMLDITILYLVSL